MLAGRDDEQAVLARLLADARSSKGRALVLHGEAGIGKSALLEAAATRAQGMILVSACGMEAEAEVGFAGLADLLGPLEGYLTELAAAQAAVLRGALATGPPGPGDAFAVYTAVRSLLSVAAEQQPLLAVVDDAHWLDAASTNALLFTARRLDGERVGLLLALRDGVSSAIDGAGLPELRLGGIDQASASRLLAHEMGLGADPAVISTLVNATGGNPLALLEAARRLDADQLAGHRPLDEPVALDGLDDVFLRQIDDLPDEAQDALLVAAAGHGAPPAVITAAIEGCGLDPQVLTVAETAGLVTFADRTITFRHPLVRSAVYHTAPPARRRAAHAALADALGSGTSRRAWHLARAATGPDERVARALDGVGEHEQKRSAYTAAAIAYARAAELTEAATARARRLLAAAQTWMLAGEVDKALAALDDAEALESGSSFLADIALVRARILLWQDPGEAARLLLHHAAQVEQDDPTRAAQLLNEAGMLYTMRGDIHTAVSLAERTVQLGELAGDSTAMLAKVAASTALVIAGHTGRAADLLADWERQHDRSEIATAPHAGALAASTMYELGQHEHAEALLVELIGQAREAGLLGVLPLPLGLLADVRIRLGRWSAAIANAEEAAHLAKATGHTSEIAHASVMLARVEAAQGKEHDCRDHVGVCLAIAERLGTDSLRSQAGGALGLLELGLGDAAAAVAELTYTVDLQRRHGVANPAVVQAHPDLVEALIRTDRRDDAAVVLAELQRQADATGHPWALAVAARCHGLLADAKCYEREFEQALRLHGRCVTPFDAARTALCYGERLRRRKHRAEARHQLHAALASFERLGAVPWAERARTELHRAGAGVAARASAPALATLTPQELRVALTVTAGATNKEAAAALFLSPKTIGFHLGNIYTKLGIGSRTELAGLVTQDASTTHL